MHIISTIITPALWLLAAAAAAAPSDSLRTFALDEVEVLSSVKEHGGERRDASAAIIGRSLMEARHARSVKDVAASVANLFIPDYGSRLTSAIYLRGVGSRSGTPAVGLYVDNVPYVDKSAFDFRFYDVERVEILRGPQATIYGRNAMGGVLNVYTRSPLAFQGTELSVGWGSGDAHRTVSLTHYHRPTAHFAFSTGGYYEASDGFFRNATTGRLADRMAAGGGRIRAIYATEKLRLDFNANYDYSDEGAYPYFGAMATEQSSFSDGQPDWDHSAILANRDSRYRRSLLNLGLNVERRWTQWQLNAVTGFQHLTDRMFMDQDFSSADIYTLTQRQRITTLTEEITAKSRGGRTWDWLTGVSAHYQWLRTEAPVTFRGAGMEWLSATINRTMPSLADVPMMGKMGFSAMSVDFGGGEMVCDGTFRTPSLSLAMFHRSTLHLTDRLALTAGLRLDYELDRLRYASGMATPYTFTLHNALRPQMSVVLPLEASVATEGRMSDRHTRLLPKAELRYALSPRSHVYASVAMGQRSGGYNVQMFSDVLQTELRRDMMSGVRDGIVGYITGLTEKNPMMPQTLPETVAGILDTQMPQVEAQDPESLVAYRPERSWNYEGGASLSLLGDRLRLDASAFLMYVSDQQIQRFAPTGLGRMVVNAGKSRSYGGELSCRLAATPRLSLTASYGFTHAVFTDYDAGRGNDYTGCRVPFTPRHTMASGCEWSIPTPARWHSWLRTLTVGADVTGAGKIYWTESNDFSQPFYATLGAHATLSTRDLTVSLWGRNLTSTHYDTFLFETRGQAFAQHCKPLRMGVDITVRL